MALKVCYVSTWASVPVCLSASTRGYSSNNVYHYYELKHEYKEMIGVEGETIESFSFGVVTEPEICIS